MGSKRIIGSLRDGMKYVIIEDILLEALRMNSQDAKCQIGNITLQMLTLNVGPNTR